MGGSRMGATRPLQKSHFSFSVHMAQKEFFSFIRQDCWEYVKGRGWPRSLYLKKASSQEEQIMRDLHRKKTQRLGWRQEVQSVLWVLARVPFQGACHTPRPPRRMTLDSVRACVPRFMWASPFHTTGLHAWVPSVRFLLCEL